MVNTIARKINFFFMNNLPLLHTRKSAGSCGVSLVECGYNRAVGFIGYLRDGDAVRIFLECSEPARDYSYAVDVVFQPKLILRGVTDVLCLKKFYKLVNSLEERAREHGREWQRVFESPESLMQHLAWTRNAREFAHGNAPRQRQSGVL